MRALGFTVAAAAVIAAPGLVPASVEAAPSTYTATLSAAEEVPVPGPPGGTGAATITIDVAAGTLCYDLSWSSQVGTPNAGHIHKGPQGTSGPIEVIFNLPAQPKACMQVPAVVLQEITSDPGGHYVNIHSNAYPNGAVRGQLH
jgi:CHRD domain